MSEAKSHVSSFSTDMLPEHDRFDQFLEQVARKLIGVDVERRSGAAYRTSMRSVSLGPVICNAIDYSAASWGRTSSLLADGNDDFVFHICEDMPYHDSVRDQVVGVGQAVLVDNSQLSRISSDTGGSALVLLVPRKVLLQRIPGAEDLARNGIMGDGTELRLLRSYVSTLLNSPSVGAATLHMAGHHIIDLLAHALGTGQNSTHSASPTGLRAARLLSVRQTITARLHEPRLSLTDIAKANSISERYVQRLFEGFGTSFSDYLLCQRLELAHKLLLNPLNRHRKIADLAIECGFGDLSYFNRSFRLRFCETPSGIRDRQTIA